MEKRENKPAKSLTCHLKELGLSPSCANQTFFPDDELGGGDGDGG